MGVGGKGNIIKALEELDKKDIYSLILFCLYKLKNNPNYSTLSELIYVLDNENFIKFINYYGGQTITIPTITDLNNILTSLLALEDLENNDSNLDAILKKLDVKVSDKKQVIQNMQVLKELLNVVMVVVLLILIMERLL